MIKKVVKIAIELPEVLVQFDGERSFIEISEDEGRAMMNELMEYFGVTTKTERETDGQ